MSIFVYAMFFTIGKRNCIGEAIARLSHFIIFVGILQHFKFEINSDEGAPVVEYVLGLTLSPKPFTFRATERI